MRDMSAAQPAEDLGKLLLRLILGALILFHGFSKLGGGPAFGFVTKMVTGAGLPPALSYLVYVGEVVAPLLLIFGIWTRLAAGIVAVNMLFALWLVHTKDLFTLNQQGGWTLELQGMYLVTAIAIALLGAGSYSIGGRAGRLN
jgi:putative oxidoreductase